MSTVSSVVGVTVAQIESAQRDASFSDVAELFWLEVEKVEEDVSVWEDVCQNVLGGVVTSSRPGKCSRNWDT